MKKILFISFALIFSAMIFAQQNGPAISWTTTAHDFGVISEDSGLQEFTFEFVNTGNEPLILVNVKPSCGCTSADYTREPVEPGAKGIVKAGYNPKGRGFGKFNKSITITTNETQPTSYLRITGEVPNPDPQQTQNTGTVAPQNEKFDRTIEPKKIEQGDKKSGQLKSENTTIDKKSVKKSEKDAQQPIKSEIVTDKEIKMVDKK